MAAAYPCDLLRERIHILKSRYTGGYNLHEALDDPKDYTFMQAIILDFDLVISSLASLSLADLMQTAMRQL